MPVISALSGWRQEDQECRVILTTQQVKVSLSYMRCLGRNAVDPLLRVLSCSRQQGLVWLLVPLWYVEKEQQEAGHLTHAGTRGGQIFPGVGFTCDELGIRHTLVLGQWEEEQRHCGDYLTKIGCHCHPWAEQRGSLGVSDLHVPCLVVQSGKKF